VQRILLSRFSSHHQQSKIQLQAAPRDERGCLKLPDSVSSNNLATPAKKHPAARTRTRLVFLIRRPSAWRQSLRNGVWTHRDVPGVRPLWISTEWNGPSSPVPHQRSYDFRNSSSFTGFGIKRLNRTPRFSILEPLLPASRVSLRAFSLWVAESNCYQISRTAIAGFAQVSLRRAYKGVPRSPVPRAKLPMTRTYEGWLSI
jgi:hypothetical protein